MKDRQATPAQALRQDMWASVVQLICAVLLCVIYAVFLMSFGGEFLIVIKGQWILPVFLILLVGGSIASLVQSLRGLQAGERRGDRLSRNASPRSRAAWKIGWSIWNLIAVLPILWVGKVLALGALGSVPNVLIAVLALPFVGYAILLAFASLSFLFSFGRRHAPPYLVKGVDLTGAAFLFGFAAFMVVAVLWQPRWTTGVSHEPLFVAGEEPGRAYRIPAMVVLPGNSLLAFAESRTEAMSDLLDINLVMKKSEDGGRTWSALRVVEDIGNQTVHSPSPVYDRDTRTVWLPFCVDYETLYLTASHDGGVTWSDPRNVSQELHLPEGTWCHNGPGNGIQMSSGRVVIPTTQNGARVLVSDDHGATWRLGEPIGAGGEPQVFERADGALCANLRAERGGQRIVACSADEGQTWEPWSYQEDLPEAGTQASILRFTVGAQGGRDRLLFSNPGAPYRGEFTLRMSYDEARTWPISKLVYEGAAGYSQLAVLSDGSILALFEAGRYDLRESITLIRVDLPWLTDGSDRLGDGDLIRQGF